MQFNEYEKLAMRTANTKATKDMKLANFGMGLSGEAGEVTDYLKKVVFHGHELDKQKLKDELGDVLWYIATIANIAGIELNNIAEYNVEKLKKRYPNGFEKEKSINRKV